MKIIKQAKPRNKEDDRRLRSDVSDMIDRIVSLGDEALIEYSTLFDGCSRRRFRVSREEIDEAYAQMSDQDIGDLREAKANIEAFAKAQLDSIGQVRDFSPRPGIFLGHRIIPVSSCCCYVPGGSYPLFSTALMLITPAKAAGVKRVVATAPVVHGTDSIHYKTLVAMDIAGADEIYALGGVQAVAAFSYGTDQIRPVDVIVGPGNRYVAEAKRQCYGQVGIDFIAGPSEVLIIADGAADPKIISADLLAQCEHDPNAKGYLITTDASFAEKVLAQVEEDLATLETADIARRSWEDFGEVVLVDDLDEAVRICNDAAPEHLEVNISDPDSIIDDLVNYGSLFIGENTAEVFGDYASGTNHTLPTVRAARYTGGVWAGTFLKTCTDQRMTPEASADIAPLVSRMARGEGLMAHALAAERRTRK